MAKGFTVPRKTARLIFEDPEYAGCEVVCGVDVSFEQLAYFAGVGEDTDNEEMFRAFADSFIISWNIEDKDGNPLSANGDGIVKLPAWFAILIMQKWQEAMIELSQVPDPLDGPSKNGEKSAAPSAKTAPRSKRRRKSATPSS